MAMCESTSQQEASSQGGSPPLSRIGLNSHKAGMDGLDRDKINQIILQASKGSKYYQSEVCKDQEITKRVNRMLDVLKRITPDCKAAAMKQVDKEKRTMEMSRSLSRIIVHVDMDAFYAAVEMRDNPHLKHIPMAVGSNSMLSTSNYIARRYGVRAAMPGFIAKKLCPELVVVSPNFEKYHRASEEVKKVLTLYDPNFCPMGLDESYLDLTEHVKTILNSGISTNPPLTEDHCRYDLCLSELSKPHWLCADHVVQEIRGEICKATGLTASAGIAPNKMLAKVASDRNKPDGQYLVEPKKEAILKFMKELSIRKICGIGKVTEKMLNALDITLCHHLHEKRDILHLLFSQTSSSFFLAVSLGLGSVQVQRLGERKSMSAERSFNEISTPDELLAKCMELCQLLSNDMKKERIKARTVTMKMKTIGFDVKSRGLTLPSCIYKCEELYQVASDLILQEIKACGAAPLKLRLMGIRVSNLQTPNNNQGTLMSYFKPIGPNPELSLDNLSTTESRTASHPSDEALITCPICNLLVSSENSLLNKHIDECLNKEAEHNRCVRAHKRSQENCTQANDKGKKKRHTDLN